MALITIVLSDGAQGLALAVYGEPAMPSPLDIQKPTDAQNAAAIMLNALQAEMSKPQIDLPFGH